MGKASSIDIFRGKEVLHGKKMVSTVPNVAKFPLSD